MTQRQALLKLVKITDLASALDKDDGSEMSSLMANIQVAVELATKEVPKHWK